MSDTEKEQIIKISKLMFDRGLNDVGGGNISLRKNNLVYITQAGCGSKYLWDIKKENICVYDIIKDKIISKNKLLSREAKIHLGLYKAIKEIVAIIHAHPPNVLVFACSNRKIEPQLEYVRKFGTIELVKAAEAHSEELADNVINYIRDKIEELDKHGVAVMLPYHGIVVVSAKGLPDAFDTLERIEINARCLLLQKLLTG